MGKIKRLVALGIVLLFAGALWFFNSSGTVHPRANPRGAVLAKMGSMTCYLYTENITTITGNSTERTFVEATPSTAHTSSTEGRATSSGGV